MSSPQANYAFYLDNLSHLPVWLSDGLCRLVTGDGFTKRELYTNDEDVLYSYRRIAGISGINQVASKADLLDRSILIQLERITENQRKEEKELWSEFDEVKPYLLGAVFDAVSACLKTAPSLVLSSRPRMADYFKYATAAAIHLGWKEEDLIRSFEQNTVLQNEEAIDSSPVATTIIQFMETQNEWQGSSTELYTKLEIIADNLKIKQGFPKSPNWLWKRIKEIRPNLLSKGITANRERNNTTNLITLTKTTITTSTVKVNDDSDSSDNKIAGDMETSELLQIFN